MKYENKANKLNKIISFFHRHDAATCFFGGFLVGVICFFIVFGYETLNPHYDAFIINEKKDLPGFQIVWDAYRYAGWDEGLGEFNTLTYPENTSIILQDEVALLAFVLKIISPILPPNFQYVGLWALMCFALQGAISAVILKKITGRKSLSILCSVVFVLASPMFTRLYKYHGQAGHWLILLALCYWVYCVKKENSWWKELIVWCVFGVLAAGTNMYILPMIGMLFLGYALNRILLNKKCILPMLGSLITFLGGAVGIVAILGGFQTSFSSDDSFYAEYIDRLIRCGANMNTFFNSSGIAYFGKALELSKDGQGEGHAYLGMGMCVILVCVVAYYVSVLFSNIHNLYINKIKKSSNEKAESNREIIIKDSDEKKMYIAMLAVFIVSCIVAMGPTVSFGKHFFGIIPYPQFMLKLWCNFRSTGRMIWPAYYILLLWIFKTFFDIREKFNKQAFATVFLCICIVIQIVDVSPYLVGLHDACATYQELDTTIKSDAWEYLGTHYSHMVVLPNSLTNRSDERNILAKVAIDYDLTLNDYYLARQNLNDQTDVYKALFDQCQYGSDVFYVVPYGHLGQYLHYGMHFYKIDDYIVFTIEDISSEIGIKEISKNALEYANASTTLAGINYSAVYDPIYYYYSYNHFWDEEFDGDKLLEYFVSEGMKNGERGNKPFNPVSYRAERIDLEEQFGDGWPEYYYNYLADVHANETKAEYLDELENE